jgi:phosphate transport system substrate-binding protein
VQNESGAWVQPYAENIAAALTKANLRPDLSQELSRVYTNPDPKAYPISAYSYLMTPCATGRNSCKGS